MGSIKSLRVIIPMKPVYGSKSRLASVLDLEQRAALSLVLLQHVLEAVKCAKTKVDTWVIGGDERVKALSTRASAMWQIDPGGGLNEAVRQAAKNAFSEGVPAILVLPGDLGFLRGEDIDQLVTLSRGFRHPVLARASSDGGTNAILAPRGLLPGPCFGPDSFKRHLEMAFIAKHPAIIASTHGLNFDLDTPTDLVVYRMERLDLDDTLTSWQKYSIHDLS